MKRVLIYYPFEITGSVDSGSKVRPIEMLKAFRSWGKDTGVEIVVISGTSKEREEQFNQLKKENKLENLHFCYMENKTIPIWLTDPKHLPSRPLIDYQVLSFLKKNGVPVGIFYRDVYWKFDNIYPLKGIKKNVMKAIYRLEEKFYEKYTNVIFLPSIEMGKYVDINRKKVALPPGGKDLGLTDTVKDKKEVPKAVYVGGINNEDYGLFLLVDAIEEVNAQEDRLQLTVVCRKNEFETLSNSEKDRFKQLNIDVKHISGDELQQFYQQVDFAFIPRLRSEYNDFAVPVKLVEYLSNQLPVVATDCSAQKNIIETGEYGIVCEAKKENMVKAIDTMLQNHHTYKEQIEQTFLKEHSWYKRVKDVSNVLSKEDL